MDDSRTRIMPFGFSHRFKLKFSESQVTTDAGILVCREFDRPDTLTKMVQDMFEKSDVPLSVGKGRDRVE